MSSLPLHPSIVHVPIALAVLMPVIAAGLLIAWWRQWLPRRTMFVALVLQAVLVASSFIAMRTGEGEEERVEQVVASEASIEAHEEAAEVFLWASMALLALFAAAAFVPRETAARAFASAAVIGTLVVAGLGYQVGRAGGKLVYQEGAASAYALDAQTSTGQPGDSRHHDDDDDDD